MRTLVSDRGSTVLRDRQPPIPDADDVLIRVAVVGLCRTDLYAMDGLIPAIRPLVPGHEFSGTVSAVGAAVMRVAVGQRVAVNPVLACGRCEFCRRDPADCQAPRFLGVDRDGACSEQVCVPERAVRVVPAATSFISAAFAEPVAASLAVLKADIHPDQRGLVLGDNRIAQLTRRVMQIHGFGQLEHGTEADATKLPSHAYDFLVETSATTETIAQMIRLVRPRGRIVLKSRQYRPFQLTLSEILRKEPVFQVVNYGSFDEAVRLLVSGDLEVRDLVGDSFDLADFPEALLAARADESRKTFLLL